jgi:hypothetical protein
MKLSLAPKPTSVESIMGVFFTRTVCRTSRRSTPTPQSFSKSALVRVHRHGVCRLHTTHKIQKYLYESITRRLLSGHLTRVVGDHYWVSLGGFRSSFHTPLRSDVPQLSCARRSLSMPSRLVDRRTRLYPSCMLTIKHTPTCREVPVTHEQHVGLSCINPHSPHGDPRVLSTFRGWPWLF